MGQLVVLGESPAIEGFALGGATPIHAEGAESVRQAWSALPADTVVVVLTPAAAAALGDRTSERPTVLTVTMPS